LTADDIVATASTRSACWVI